MHGIFIKKYLPTDNTDMPDFHGTIKQKISVNPYHMCAI